MPYARKKNDLLPSTTKWRRIKAGDRFGRLVARSYVRTNAGGSAYWLFDCDCGSSKVIRVSHVKEAVRSCGCLIKERVTTHGMSHTPIYNVWVSMEVYNFATGNDKLGVKRGTVIRVGGKRFVIKSYAFALSTSGSGTIVVDAYQGSTQVGSNQVANGAFTSATVLQTYPFVVPSGSQTFSLDLWNGGAGTATFYGAVTKPAWFTVEEV